MTGQSRNTALDWTQDAMQSRHDWLDDHNNAARLTLNESLSASAVDLADREHKWPPALRILFAVSLSACLWTVMLLSLFFAGALPF